MDITLKNLHLATEQQVFDKVAKHLLTQNEKAISDNGSCKYKLETTDGTILKCAVGCLISDDEYNPIIEGELYGSYDFNRVTDDWFKSPHSNLLKYLQNLHDNYPVSEWKEKLREIAERFNLNADVLEEFNKMDLTKQILTLKDIYKDFFSQELVYVEVKLTNKYIHCYIPYQDTGSGKGDEYTIDIEQYLKGYECKIAEIGYLTYQLNNSDLSQSLSKLMYYNDYKDIGLKDSQYHIPVFLYVHNDKFGLAYSNGTILNIFGDTVKKVVDKLNDMCNNNPNFKFQIDEEFYNSLSW